MHACTPGWSLLQVNGLSNLFWGWGREDDELYLRIKEVNMPVSCLLVDEPVCQLICVHRYSSRKGSLLDTILFTTYMIEMLGLGTKKDTTINMR